MPGPSSRGTVASSRLSRPLSTPVGQLPLPECPQAWPGGHQGASMGLVGFLLPLLLPTPLHSSKPLVLNPQACSRWGGGSIGGQLC